MKVRQINPHSPPIKLATALFLLLLSSAVAPTFAQTLFPDILTSNPTDSEANVGRQKGRKGLLFRFKFFNAANVEDDSAFPLDLTGPGASVTLKIGANPALACTAGSSPAANTCSFVIVAGEDDAALDTVKILFNGDFPSPSTSVQFSVSGARTTAPAVTQSADPNTVTFSTLAGGTLRSPVSLELVFDISGSMDLPAVPGGSVKRIDALKQSSQSLFAMLNSVAMLGDQVGAVYFSNTATTFDPTPGGSNLVAVNDSSSVAANVQSQGPTNGTSIGAGLQKANSPDGFSNDPAPTKRVFLLSDGEQNVAPKAVVSGSNLTIVDGGGNVLMTYDANVNVCPVTAGRLTAPGNVLQQQIAAAKCNNTNAVVGDMAQTFSTGELNTYFTQTLASVLVGDKLEHVRNVTGKLNRNTNVTEKFNANTNDIMASILLSWSDGRRIQRLPFRLKAPDGTVIETLHRTQFGFGMSLTTVNFPLRQNNAVINHKGEWSIELLATNVDAIGAVPVDFQMIVMLDNKNLASEYTIIGNDIGIGEPIPVQVKLSENGAPVTGATVVAQMLVPENGLGNVLSTANQPGGTPNTAGDPIRSEAIKKLLLLLADPASASLFVGKNLPSLVLLDNGQAANGDAVANDGIYSGRFTGAEQEGHYHFAVNVRGTTPTNGIFQRTQETTAFVRPKAVASETDLVLLGSVPQADGSVIVRLSATPRDRFRNLIGPDYLGHLNIRSSLGTVETPLISNLDGSYVISHHLPSGSSNPDITVEVMGTDVVTKSLNDIKKLGGDFKRWGLSLHAGSTFPQGFFGNVFDPGPSLGVDLEYRFTPLFSIEAFLGHDRFKNQFFNDSFYMTHLSGNAKFTFGTGTIRPSVHAGLGAYFPEGGGTRFGANVGASLQFWVTPNFAIEPSYNFRAVNFSGSVVKYSTLQGGVRFRF